MWGDGKGDARVIGDCARISSICGAVLSFTTSMSWLVLACFKLSFRTRPDYSTGSLGVSASIRSR
jgi:hypothetical protein